MHCHAIRFSKTFPTFLTCIMFLSIVSICTFKLWVKLLPHLWQAKGFAPVCVFRLSDISHIWHRGEWYWIQGFSTVSVLLKYPVAWGSVLQIPGVQYPRDLGVQNWGEMGFSRNICLTSPLFKYLNNEILLSSLPASFYCYHTCLFLQFFCFFFF